MLLSAALVCDPLAWLEHRPPATTVDHSDRTALDKMERAGYLPALLSIARGACVPFWWHGTDPVHGYRVLHNGTLCILDTRERLIGVTADHVYAQYLLDKAAHPDLMCQFGDTTVVPERHLIARSTELDLATFDLPTVLVGASGGTPHSPIFWPCDPVQERQTLLYGGYPGVLRTEHTVSADLPFQWFASAPLSVTPENLKLLLDSGNFHQPMVGAEIPNVDLGGMSGGPVYRLVATPIERLELVGFIYEFQEGLELVFARPANFIAANGQIASDL